MDSAASSALQQWRDVPREWGQSKAAYAKRFVSEYAESAIGDSTKYLIARLFDEDPSFRPCACTGLVPRLRHASVAPFRARKSDGRTGFSFARIAGVTASNAAASTWYPARRGVDGVARHIAVDFAAKLASICCGNSGPSTRYRCSPSARSRRGDRTDSDRRADLQTLIADGAVAALPLDSSAEGSRSACLCPVGVSAQSCSNTCCRVRTTPTSSMMSPTSRRFSSSNLRRLWLPRKARLPSRTMARTWRRLPGYFSATNSDFPLSTLPMILTSTPALRTLGQEP